MFGARLLTESNKKESLDDVGQVLQGLVSPRHVNPGNVDLVDPVNGKYSVEEQGRSAHRKLTLSPAGSKRTTE